MEDNNFGLKVGLSLAAMAGLVMVGIALAPFTVVDTTEKGVVLKWGEMNRVLEPGVHWRTPISEEVIKMPVDTQKIQVQASAASKDLQDVTATIALQYKLDPTKVDSIYSNLKKDYQTVVIDPAIQDAVKSATARFNAEALITNRSEVKTAIEESLKTRLATENILVSNVDIVNFSFSNAFNQAIEQKVTAEQDALKAKNDLARIQFEADQKVATAEANAEATRLEAQALASQSGTAVIEKIYAEAALEAAKKWNGATPTTVVTGGSDGKIPLFPFMELNKQ